MSTALTPQSTAEANIQSLVKTLRDEHRVDVSRARKIYCNRDLNLEKVEAIGFDMDYTLAPYIQEALDAISLRLTISRLISERGYPEEINKIEPRPDFAIRGLVIDTLHGNVLKMDGHKHVGKGYHGLEEISADDRHAYRDLTVRLGEDNERFMLIDTLYALPEAFLFAALVDYFERAQPEKRHDWARLFQDIRYCIDLAHRDGSIKDAIMADTERFVAGRDKDLAKTLHNFRTAGKKIFLITNSYPTYSNHIMCHLLDGVLPEYPNWKAYFDVVITGACKPTFFTARNPFLIVDKTGKVHGEEYSSFTPGVIYQGGNLVDFERMAGVGGERMMYVGDHIYGDIVRSKKSSAWRTVMIVQEMEDELDRAETLREEMGKLDEIDAEVFRLTERIAFDQTVAHHIEALCAQPMDPARLGELLAAKREVLSVRDDMRSQRKELILQQEIEEAILESNFNPYWGLVFRLANENTLFGEQVEDYACLYTSRVSNFRHYFPLYYFRAPRQLMPHERY